MCPSHSLEERVNSYKVSRTRDDCATFTTTEAYLIIDNARESDAGEYELEVTAQFSTPLESRKTVHVTIGVCVCVCVCVY